MFSMGPEISMTSRTSWKPLIVVLWGVELAGEYALERKRRER